MTRFNLVSCIEQEKHYQKFGGSLWTLICLYFAHIVMHWTRIDNTHYWAWQEFNIVSCDKCGRKHILQAEPGVPFGNQYFGYTKELSDELWEPNLEKRTVTCKKCK